MAHTVTTTSQLTRFAECVYERSDMVEVRRLPSGVSSWHVAAELPELLTRLTADNAKGQGVHVGINPRKDRGGRKTADVALGRCLFADFDHVGLEGAQKRWESAGLPKPTLTVNSAHGIHAYWRLVESVDCATWTQFQRDLAAVLGSDPGVHDPPRLARLPGFTNHKAPAADCVIIDADPSRTYELAELHEHIPARPDPVPTVSTNHTNGSATRGLDVIARAARYANKWECVAEGGRNASAQRHAAQLTRDFGLSDTEAGPILAAWNAGNSPPLGDVELRGCLANGRKYGKGVMGCKADSPPPRQSGKNTQPTDTVPEDAGPPWETIAEIGSHASYREGLVPITTGYSTLDAPLRGGFRPESVHIIAGRTGSAKSTLMLNIARRVALSRYSVLAFKLEEGPIEAVWRIHAAAAQVDLKTLLDGTVRATENDRGRLDDAWGLIRDLPIRLSGNRNLDTICRISKQHVDDGGQIILVDQISTIHVGSTATVFEAVTEASNRLRLLARELRVPIVVAAQINRVAAKANQKGDEPLSVHDLRDSGHIENDAATVLLIDKWLRRDGPNWISDPYRLEVHFGKNRYGPTTDPKRPLELSWWPQFARIEDVASGPMEGGRG